MPVSAESPANGGAVSIEAQFACSARALLPRKTVALSEVPLSLSAAEQGDQYSAGELLPLVYDELRKLAALKLAQEKPGQTLQATTLVHEAYVRLLGGDKPQQWDSRAHFFAAAAEAMRRSPHRERPAQETVEARRANRAGGPGRGGVADAPAG